MACRAEGRQARRHAQPAQALPSCRQGIAVHMGPSDRMVSTRFEVPYRERDSRSR